VIEVYSDGKIECTPMMLRIHGYYLPYGTKDIRYTSIRGIRRFEMSALRGKGRIWGTGNFKYWANLDVRRPVKKIGFILDIGKSVQPFVTPDRPDAFEAVIRERTGLGPSSDTPTPGPFI
jgi:hypothetical protein